MIVNIVHIVCGLLAVGTCVARAGSSKKRILIHVPLQVKQHHHTHTVYKHVVHEHDHEHQHHGEPHLGGAIEVSEESDGGGDGYVSGSNADYKVLGYTYGTDAEPVLRDEDASSSESDEEAGSRSTLRDYAKWAPSRPVRTHRRPSSPSSSSSSSSHRYRDHDVAASNSGGGGRGAGSHRGYGTRARPYGHSYKDHRPAAGSSGGKGSGGRYHYHPHQQNEYDSGSPEDEHSAGGGTSSSSSSSSEEHWDEDRKK